MSNVYFIKPAGLDGPIKIGWSKAPRDRLHALGVWSPLPLEIIGQVDGDRADELFVHTCFAHLHSHHEWFRSAPELRDGIVMILEANNARVIAEKYPPRGDIQTLASKMRRYHPNERLRTSYAHRIYWANKRLNQKDGLGSYSAPSHIENILSGWRGHTAPSTVEIAKLDAYLADPAAHDPRRAMAAA